MSDPLLDRYTPGTYANRDAMANEREVALLARVERLTSLLKGVADSCICEECDGDETPHDCPIADLKRALSEDKHE